MTESILYQSYLKVNLTKRGWFTFRVEHPRLPDVYCIKNNKVIWIELKVVNNIQEIVAPDWRSGQLSWILENKLFGNSDNIYLYLWYVGKIYLLHPQQYYTQGELKCQMTKIFL
jgi:hypothetical protein